MHRPFLGGYRETVINENEKKVCRKSGIGTRRKRIYADLFNKQSAFIRSICVIRVLFRDLAHLRYLTLASPN